MTRRTQVLSPDQFDALVEGWNSLSDKERQRRGRTCSQDGHVYVETPYATPAESHQVCVHCLSYVTE